MEDELVLKEKYNDLLKSFQEGTKYLEEHPEEEKKVQKRLDEITQELSNIMDALPEMTENEKMNGFKIEKENINNNVDDNDVIYQDKDKLVVRKIETIANNSLQSFSDDWKMAEKICKSSIIPKEFQGKPENVLLCMGMSQKMGLDLITVVNNLQMVMRTSRMERQFYTCTN